MNIIKGAIKWGIKTAYPKTHEKRIKDLKKYHQEAKEVAKKSAAWVEDQATIGYSKVKQAYGELKKSVEIYKVMKDMEKTRLVKEEKRLAEAKIKEEHAQIRKNMENWKTGNAFEKELRGYKRNTEGRQMVFEIAKSREKAIQYLESYYGATREIANDYVDHVMKKAQMIGKEIVKKRKGELLETAKKYIEKDAFMGYEREPWEIHSIAYNRDEAIKFLVHQCGAAKGMAEACVNDVMQMAQKLALPKLLSRKEAEQVRNNIEKLVRKKYSNTGELTSATNRWQRFRATKDEYLSQKDLEKAGIPSWVAKMMIESNSFGKKGKITYARLASMIPNKLEEAYYSVGQRGDDSVFIASITTHPPKKWTEGAGPPKPATPAAPQKDEGLGFFGHIWNGFKIFGSAIGSAAKYIVTPAGTRMYNKNPEKYHLKPGKNQPKSSM